MQSIWSFFFCLLFFFCKKKSKLGGAASVEDDDGEGAEAIDVAVNEQSPIAKSLGIFFIPMSFIIVPCIFQFVALILAPEALDIFFISHFFWSADREAMNFL